MGGVTEFEGRLEYCFDDTWGTVCDDGWSTPDARVACRQLGYSTLGTFIGAAAMMLTSLTFPLAFFLVIAFQSLAKDYRLYACVLSLWC